MSDGTNMKRSKELKFAIDNDVARGRYTNLALIGHTRNEFVLDFAFAAPRQNPAVVARLITSPGHAKALLRSLEDNIRRYEAQHGAIPEAKPANDTEPN